MKSLLYKCTSYELISVFRSFLEILIIQPGFKIIGTALQYSITSGQGVLLSISMLASNAVWLVVVKVVLKFLYDAKLKV